MSSHQRKFAPGDRVVFLPSMLGRNVRRGLYTIVRALPITNQGAQYRVKHDHDQHERVVDEAQLLPAD